MDKLLTFPGRTENGIFTYVLDAERNYLEKTASQYHPTIASYINAAKPIRGKTQILLTALGAGEYWGCNVNGDFFEETELAHEGEDYGFKTFERYAKIYKHHINKDPKASYGDVALSVYNPAFHRVELIVVLDNARAPDTREKIESGQYPEWSMGCRVKHDVCSVCGNKAPTRKQYCEHAKYYLTKIHPETGKQVYVKNPKPVFFDISEVFIGADKTAKTLRKVASAVPSTYGIGWEPSSAVQAEKSAATFKEADIEKEVPTNEPPASVESLKDLARGIMEVKAREKSLPTDLLNRLGSYPLGQSVSTMAMLGILPKPQEFQRIVLVSLGKRDVADDLDSRCLCFDPAEGDASPEHERRLGLSADSFSPQIMRLLSPFMEQRSYAAPHLAKRLVIMVKQASEEPLPTFVKLGKDNERKPIGIIPMLALAAGMYAVLAKKAPPEAVKGIDKLISQHPGMAAAMGLGIYASFSALAKPGTRGNFVPGSSYVNPDANDIFARIEAQKTKPYMKVAFQVGPAAKRLFLGIPAAYMASGVLQKHRELSPYDEEGRIKSFVRRNPDVISGALIADAMLSLRGKGTHGLLKSLAKSKSGFEHAQDALKSVAGSNPGLKTASAQEFLSNAVIWPLALGTANLPGRMMMGAFDSAALEVMKHIGKRRKSREQGQG